MSQSLSFQGMHLGFFGIFFVKRNIGGRRDWQGIGSEGLVRCVCEVWLMVIKVQKNYEFISQKFPTY